MGVLIATTAGPWASREAARTRLASAGLNAGWKMEDRVDGAGDPALVGPGHTCAGPKGQSR